MKIQWNLAYPAGTGQAECRINKTLAAAKAYKDIKNEFLNFSKRIFQFLFLLRIAVCELLYSCTVNEQYHQW